MGVNKNQLQVNNGDLSGILSYIDQMAVGGEDLTEEVLAQPPLVAQIMALAGRKAGVEKEGLYVWKKYNTPTKYLTLYFELITDGVNPSIIQVSSEDVDLSTIDADFFIGFKGTHTYIHSTLSTEHMSKFEFKSDGVFEYGGGDYTYTYDSNTYQITVTVTMHKQRTSTITDYIVEASYGYVVADYEDAYPDGAVDVDGYWYEKVVEGYSAEDLGFTEMCVDTLVYATDTNTYQLGVPHSLGKVPSGFLIVASEKVSTANHIRYSIGFNSLPYYESTERGIDGILSVYSSSSYNGTYGETEGASNTGYVDNLTLNTNKNNLMFAAGVEYKLITWA